MTSVKGDILWITCGGRSSQAAPVSSMMMSLTRGGRGARSGGEMTSSAQPTGNNGLLLVNTDYVTIILTFDWSTNAAQLTGALQ